MRRPWVPPSDDDAVLQAQMADPMVIKVPRADTVAGMVDLMGSAQAAAGRLEIPALVLYGMKDGVIPRRQMARMVASLPNTAADRQRVAIYRDGYHLLLRDRNAALVVKISWPGSPTHPAGRCRPAR